MESYSCSGIMCLVLMAITSAPLESTLWNLRKRKHFKCKEASKQPVIPENVNTESVTEIKVDY